MGGGVHWGSLADIDWSSTGGVGLGGVCWTSGDDRAVWFSMDELIELFEAELTISVLIVLVGKVLEGSVAQRSTGGGVHVSELIESDEARSVSVSTVELGSKVVVSIGGK